MPPRRLAASRGATDHGVSMTSESSVAYKHCRKCDQTKRIEEFHRDASRSSGHSSTCKSCVNSRRRAHSADSPERRTELSRKSLEYNRQHKEQLAEYMTKYRKTEKYLTRLRNVNAARRARKKSVDHGCVTSADISYLLTLPCTYCSAQAEHVDHYIPLARGGAHCRTNLRPACVACNSAKRDKMPETWLEIKGLVEVAPIWQTC